MNRQVSSILIASAALISACGGRALDLGTANSSQTASNQNANQDGGPGSDKLTCPASACGSQSNDACAFDSPTQTGGTGDFFCVPDPNAGEGSDPAGACLWDFQCVQSTNDCDSTACAGQTDNCALTSSSAIYPNPTTISCVPDPSRGQNGVSATACILQYTCVTMSELTDGGSGEN